MRYLLLLLLSCGAGVLSAQPLLNHTCEWYEESGGSGSGVTTHSYYRYYFNGDTTIGGQTYFKVFRQGVDSTWNTNVNTTDVQSFNDYSGALRDDEHRFFVVYRNQSTERLLITFLIPEIGNGTPMAVFGGCGPAPGAAITNLAPLSLGTQSRPCYLAQGTFSAIIEGVGTTGGMFAEGSGCLFFESYHRLVCFKKDNNLMTVNGSRPCGLSVAPNPDCQARYCSRRDDSAGMERYTIYNQSTANLAADFISSSYLHFNGQVVLLAPGQQVTLTNPTPGNSPYADLRIMTNTGCYSSVANLLPSVNTCTLSAVNAVRSDGIFCTLFPNPVRQRARFQCPAAVSGAEWQLYDGEGRLVRHLRFCGSTAVFDRTGLPDGMYFYNLSWKNAVVIRGKVLVIAP